MTETEIGLLETDDRKRDRDSRNILMWKAFRTGSPVIDTKPIFV